MEFIEQYVKKLKRMFPDLFSVVLAKDRDKNCDDAGIWTINISANVGGVSKILMPLVISEVIVRERVVADGDGHFRVTANDIMSDVINNLRISISQMEVLVNDCEKRVKEIHEDTVRKFEAATKDNKK